MGEHELERAGKIQGCACVFAAIAVILGAFGAHALEERLSEEALEWYHTAVEYHFIHALALWFAGGAVRVGKSGLPSAVCFATGITVFCGSLYALALTGQTWLGAVTPVGGVAFILGWSLLALAMFRRR